MATYKFYQALTNDDTDMMGGRPSNPPEEIFVWRVDIVMPGSELEVCYRNVAKASRNGKPIDDYIVSLAKGEITPDWKDVDKIRTNKGSQRRLTPFSLH